VSDFLYNLDPLSLPLHPVREPTEIRAGDTVQWTREFDRFPPADGYSLSYVFVSQVSQYLIEATAGTESYTVDVSGATTAAWAPGWYRWQAYVKDGSGNRYTVAEDKVQVLPNLEVATSGIDDREPDEIILSNIVAMLQGKATKDVQEYEINGRRLTYYRWDELVKMRAVFEARVRQIRLRRGDILPTRTIGVTFRNGY
jgi:hypothetical protein